MKTTIQHLANVALVEGKNTTAIDGVAVYKATKSTGKQPLCYSQGVIFVFQGNKVVHLGDETFHYDADNYLVLSLPLPAECETFVEEEKPMFSLMIDFDIGLLSELVRIFDKHHQRCLNTPANEAKSLYASPCHQNLKDSLNKLVACLASPLRAEALGQLYIREIFYYLLQGPQAASLFALVSHNTQLSRLERVIKHLHEHYNEQLDIDQLANMANMSSSSFHRNFKQVTASSPIQYVKKMRLNRAKELLQDQGIKVKQAAAQVGYESPTQFSREFKRYFGESPQLVSRH